MSLHALHLANGRTSNTGVFRLMGRLLSGTGVIESTAFTVSAQLTPDMTVKVSGSTASDNLVIITTGGDTYHGWNTANANVTITSNSSGVTKKDHIVAYVDTALTTTTPDNPAGLVLIAVRGTGTAAPTDSEINTATGSKPWIRLAEVSVANGASSINSGNITDLRTFAGMSKLVSGIALTNPTFTYTSNQVIGSTRVKITEFDIESNTISITFNSIPQVFRNLTIEWAARSNNSTPLGLAIRFNGDTGANYDIQNWDTTGTNGGAAAESFLVTAGSVGAVGGTSSPTSHFNMGVIQIPLYRSTTMHKVAMGHGYRKDSNSSGGMHNIYTNSDWRNTAAITSISLAPANFSSSFIAGSYFVLYGEP